MFVGDDFWVYIYNLIAPGHSAVDEDWICY